MSMMRRMCAGMIVVGVAGAPIHAGEMVPFKGIWTGQTVAADLSTFPVVGVVAEGSGHVTGLGRTDMVSPHTTNVFTGETLGEQIFTAANNDVLTAYCAGFATPDGEGVVRGTLDCTITGGTGRFVDATGSYTFSLTATPFPPGGAPGYNTVAVIAGEIASVGSRNR